MTHKLTPYELALWAALPMAHTPRIEGRLKMILDRTRPRCALTRRALLTALGVGAATLVPLAMLRPTARAQAVTQEVAAPAALIGIADTAAPRGPWWDPDGKALPEPALDTNLNAGMIRASVARPRQQGRLFAFRMPVNIQDPAPALLYDFRDETPGGLALPYRGGYTRMTSIQTSPGIPDKGNAVEGYAAAFPASLAKTTLFLGVAGGPWREVVDCPKTPGKVRFMRPSGVVLFTLIPNPHHLPAAQAARGDAVIMVSDHFHSTSALRADNPLQVALHDGQNFERAVYALDHMGRVVSVLNVLPQTWPESAGPGDNRPMKTEQITHLPNSLLKRVASFRLVARPYKWVVFHDVALQPKS